jgi:hypothetical protein
MMNHNKEKPCFINKQILRSGQVSKVDDKNILCHTIILRRIKNNKKTILTSGRLLLFYLSKSHFLRAT